MFQHTKALFFYCISPVHMGSGQALGLIDNPIQREVHTGWPIFAGSGIKGAVRHQLRLEKGWDKQIVEEYFGPESSGDTGYAGAVSFTDAQLLAFPVRSLKRGYVYATCPTALARARRILDIAGEKPDWETSEIGEGAACIGHDELQQGAEIILEALAFSAATLPQVGEIGAWLAERALPEDQTYFRDKLAKDLVILSDTDFTHFAKNSTLVEPHVCIDRDTGTAKGAGLFYTENLPPEALLIGAVMTSQTRNGNDTPAEIVMGHITDSLTTLKTPLQLGGDATTGRGLVQLSFVGG
jgi:CRISPR-associated protein Cmr4